MREWDRLDAADSGGGMADDRAKTGAWKGFNPRDGRGSFHPLKRRRQWLDSASSMVGDASVNGLSSATQWMERCDSMDGTSHFNGLTIACPSPASPPPTFREKWEIWQG